MKNIWGAVLGIILLSSFSCYQIDESVQANVPFLSETDEADESTPASLKPPLTVLPLTSTASPTASSTSTPLLDTAHNIDSTPTSNYEADISGPCTLNPMERMDLDAPIQNAILFISNTTTPLNRQGNVPSPSAGIYDPNFFLWAVSTDGQQANYLAPDDNSTDWLIPTMPFPNLSFTETGQNMSLKSQIDWFPLPDICASPPESIDYWKPCSSFEYSPDGHWLLFQWGQEICGAQFFGFLDLQTGHAETMDYLMWVIKFLPNGWWLVGNSHCQVAYIYLLNPNTRDLVLLGRAGDMVWNGNETAFAVSTPGFNGPWASIFGYNIETAERFIAIEGGKDYRPIWMPDDTTLLYQHREITMTNYMTITYGLSQIHSVDAGSGVVHILASDPQYDYHLCASEDTCNSYGDWVPVRRVRYYPGSFYFEDFSNAAFRCIEQPIYCPDPVEQWALNWRTGELIPWETLIIPTTTPYPIEIPPWYLDKMPIYTDPEKGTSFYVGEDGHSLWCVSPDGTAVQWVKEGFSFTYVP